jgi:hypothetical protein
MIRQHWPGFTKIKHLVVLYAYGVLDALSWSNAYFLVALRIAMSAMT